MAQRYAVQPDAYCRELKIPVPTSVSMKDKTTPDLFSVVVGVCINPFVAIPGRKGKGSWGMYVAAGVSVAVVAVIAGFYFRRR